MTLDQLPLLSWVRLAFGLLIFLGPGYLLLTLSPFRRDLDKTLSLVAAYGLSVALWAIFLSITNLLKLHVPSWLAILLFSICLLLGVWVNRPRVKGFSPFRLEKDTLYRLFLWILLAVAFIVGLWSIRNEVAGLGSDSYHHTLFTQMIMDEGRIPENYGPFTPVITFTYHFGFHAMTAFLGWVSGIPSRLLLLAVGQILVVLCAASVAVAAEKMTEHKTAGIAAAILTALVGVFPSYMLEWGRYTQLTGLTLMALFLGLFWNWLQRDLNRQSIPLLAILAAGIGLTHYRVVAMTTVAVIALAIVYGVGRLNFLEWKRMVSRGAVLAAASSVGLAPWFWHLWEASYVGYRIVSVRSNIFLSITRLGVTALDHPLNIPVLVICLFFTIIGVLMRERVVIGMTLWTAFMLLTSGYTIFMDRVSVLISLFIPAAIVIGWGIFHLDQKIQRKCHKLLGRKVVPILLFAFFASGLIVIFIYPIQHDGYVRASDLKAIDYIKEKVPEDAYFMINIYRFSFSDTLMVGSDAGYWLPILANRRAAVPPMVYSSERVSDPNYSNTLRKLESLEGQITTPSGLEMLREQGFTHVFIGERGGPIQPEALERSSSFQLLYHEGASYIYKVIP